MNWGRLLFIPPILVGIAIFYLMTRPDTAGDGALRAEAAIAVRVAVMQPESFTASASGFGHVSAEKIWQAISQVDGRVLETLADLAVGKVAPAGAVVVRIDPRDYQIAKAKAEANLASAKAQLDEMAAQENNTKSLLALEAEIEAFQQTEFDRKAKLGASKTIAQASVDQANRDLLNQQRKVLELKNTLTLFPVQRVSLLTTIQTRQAELEEAERALENTVIIAPLTGRITEENLAIGQYVRPGDRLLTVEGNAASEIVAEFQPSAIGRLIRAVAPDNVGDIVSQLHGEIVVDLFKQLGIRAEVQVSRDGRTFIWPAELVRSRGSADAATGALGIVVRVDDPSRPNPAQRRPPLANGAFAEVRLVGPEKQSLLITRDAVHRTTDGGLFVYVMDEENRLRRKTFVPGPAVGDKLVVREGIAAGEVIVLSDPQPAILGMALEPVTEAEGTLTSAASQ